MVRLYGARAQSIPRRSATVVHSRTYNRPERSSSVVLINVSSLCRPPDPHPTPRRHVRCPSYSYALIRLRDACNSFNMNRIAPFHIHIEYTHCASCALVLCCWWRDHRYWVGRQPFGTRALYVFSLPQSARHIIIAPLRVLASATASSSPSSWSLVCCALECWLFASDHYSWTALLRRNAHIYYIYTR